MKKIFFLGVCLIFLLPACNNSTSGDAKTTISPTFTDIYTQVFSKKCTECHVPSGSAYKQDGVHIDFSSLNTAYQSLSSLKVKGPTSGSACQNVSLIYAGKVLNSALAGILFSDYNNNPNFANATSCQLDSSHLQGISLQISTEQKNAIIQWIESGAANN